MAERNSRKSRVGTVVSNGMNKTVVVDVQRQVVHPVYGRTVRKQKKYMAHDEENGCNVGDRVVIVETRPLSRHKRWRVSEIVTRAV